MSGVIKTPTLEIPPARRPRRHTEAYAAAIRAAGVWVPVEFETLKEVDAFRTTVKRKVGYEAQVRGLTVYVRYIDERESAKAPPE